MKKILLATTVLAMTASVAAAEVAVSGSARMGIVNDGTDTAFSSRVRIVFAGSGTTDGGLSFGAEMRADQNGGNASGTANGDSTVFVSGSFGTLTMGDVAGGAADNLVGQVSGVGYTGLGDNNEIGFLGGTATAARYNYTSGALSVAVGIGQPTAADEAASVAVKYAAGSYSVALGYSDTATDSQVDLKGTATFGAATVSARVADRDSAADVAYALSLDYVAGAATVTAFMGDNVNFAGRDTAGLGVSYDLGGGAAVKAGVADNGTDTIYEAGVTLSF
ncbi:porin [Rhodobacter sp. KR11]|jgi:outer membrane protein OmpU|uniref:porin n=1 Tax=Rhodobacter sp. KR11 TaxID=2974588 RepID=UPI0022214811|nr:porin [Rhodobacter sp. KR11]MCW1917267.1 porin [Rhodobacter sp. KR11]